MSAGIVSACLPTLLPIVFQSLQFFGLKQNSAPPSSHDVPVTFGSSGGQANRHKKRSRSTESSAMELAEHGDSVMGNDDSLDSDPSDTASSCGACRDSRLLDNASELRNPSFRGDLRGYGHAATGFASKGGAAFNDDIPMSGIQVQKHFERQSSKP